MFVVDVVRFPLGNINVLDAKPINDKLAQRNAELMKWNADLSKQCTTYSIISQFYLHKYLNAQNDVDFCKREINCTDYLSKKRWLEFMIETYTGILKERGQNV